MEITYDYYRIFYYAAKYKSFSRAAEILSSNQPNITRCINNLESQLGCKLFIRSNRGAALTPEGEKLYRHAAIAYEQLKTAELELSEINSMQSGRIAIGVSETALHGILLSILRDFHAEHPKIRLSIYNHSTPQAIQALKNGTIDFAVVTTPADVKKPFTETVLKSFHEILVGGPQYEFLSHKSHTLEQISHYPLICLGKDTKTYEFYTNLFLQHRLVLDPDTEAATADQLMPMIECGLGIGFVPESFAEKSIESKKAFEIPLRDTIPKRAICLVEDSGRKLNIAADKLKQILLNIASE